MTRKKETSSNVALLVRGCQRRGSKFERSSVSSTTVIPWVIFPGPFYPCKVATLPPTPAELDKEEAAEERAQNGWETGESSRKSVIHIGDSGSEDSRTEQGDPKVIKEGGEGSDRKDQWQWAEEDKERYKKEKKKKIDLSELKQCHPRKFCKHQIMDGHKMLSCKENTRCHPQNQPWQLLLLPSYSVGQDRADSITSNSWKLVYKVFNVWPPPPPTADDKNGDNSEPLKNCMWRVM